MKLVYMNAAAKYCLQLCWFWLGAFISHPHAGLLTSTDLHTSRPACPMQHLQTCWSQLIAATSRLQAHIGSIRPVIDAHPKTCCTLAPVAGLLDFDPHQLQVKTSAHFHLLLAGQPVIVHTISMLFFNYKATRPALVQLKTVCQLSFDLAPAKLTRWCCHALPQLNRISKHTLACACNAGKAAGAAQAGKQVKPGMDKENETQQGLLGKAPAQKPLGLPPKALNERCAVQAMCIMLWVLEQTFDAAVACDSVLHVDIACYASVNKRRAWLL